MATSYDLGAVSTYALAVQHGFVGTIADWVQAIVSASETYDTLKEQIESLELNIPLLDSTLSYNDRAANAYSVGEYLRRLETLISTPLASSTIAEMTDTTKVYVYTGSETGYTAGNWYYYNGTAWVSGGIYNAEAITTDTTLTIAGSAADAKKVGDELSDIKEDLQAVRYLDDLNISNYLTWEIGSINLSDGAELSSTTRIRCVGYFDLSDITELTFSIESGYKYVIDWFDSSKNTLVSVSPHGVWQTANQSITVPTVAKYARFLIADISDGTAQLSYSSKLIITGSFPLSRVPKDTAEQLQNIDLNISEIEDTLSDITVSKTGLFPVECPYADGYYLINSSGALVNYTSGNSWKVSELFDVSNYSEIYVSGSSGWGNLICAFYDTGSNFVSGYASGSSLTSVTDEPISVPTGAKYARVGTYDYASIPISVKVNKTVVYNSALYKWSTKKWACIGDSLTEYNTATTKHYFDYVAEQTGINISNHGIGGTGYANPNGTAGNFTTRMASVPTDADVYTIFGSFNDYAYSLSNDIPIGEPTDSGTSTLCGYFNGAFDALFERVPMANLGVVAPCPWVSVNAVDSITFGKDYTDALKAVCERRSIPFMNLYIESGMRPWDENFVANAYTKDPLEGVHPDEIGHAILAPKFKEFLEMLLM